MQTTTLTEADVARLLAQKAGVTEDVDRATVFDDLGVDSLALLGMVQFIENNYGVDLPETAEAALTVGEFLDTVNTALAQAV